MAKPQSYRFSSIAIENGAIKTHPPQAHPSADARFALIFHVFYPELFFEAAPYLEAITTPYDLYITLPEGIEEEAVRRIAERFPQAQLFLAENRGRDVLPFLQVLRLIGTERYPYICKLHTKRTGGSALGEVWRKLLYFDLIGSDESVKKILEIFERDPDVCMVTGKNAILDSRRYDYGNTAKIDALVKKCGLLFGDHYDFAGGTMFWARTKLLEPLLRLFEAGELDFEEEAGQKDHTIAHAIERFFGILCKAAGKKILPAPTSYKELDEATLEQLASLVLSQQYHGEDAFELQNRAIRELYTHIDELYARIHELEELADLKRRFKKAVRERMPTGAWETLKSAKRIALTLKRNPALLKKALYYIRRGEFGHLMRKIRQKSEGNLKRLEDFDHIIPQHIFGRFAKSDFELPERVDVIVPVYNGYEHLERLFASLERHTTTPYRLIVVEDASSDERVRPYLKERLKAFPGAILIEHDQNQGFVKSVNEAVAMGEGHFVILNSDTEVPPFWLERLMRPILDDESVASTTPFTNAGTIASFPKFLEDNEIFEGMDVAELDEVFREIDPKRFYTEIPTGVGFCMGVNRKAVRELGFFDEELFEKGYGEENDWCQRAIAAGYRNLLVPNLFVYHKHGGSFTPQEKRRLMERNAAKLLKRHPEYEKQVHDFIQKDPLRPLRALLTLLAAAKARGGAHLIVDHALGGGANIYAKKRADELHQKSECVATLAYDYYSGLYTLHYHFKEFEHGFLIHDFEGVATLLRHLPVKEILLNSLVSYKEIPPVLAAIKELKAIYGAKLIVPIHDYHVICPNFTLLDENAHFCGVPADLARCDACMARNRLEWRSFGDPPMDVASWRKMWGEILGLADEILCFSESSRDILTRAYPDAAGKIAVRPHTIEPLPRIAPPPAKKERLTLGILGAINQAKGAGIVRELVQKLDEQDLPVDVVLIGEISEPISSRRFRATGRYERSELPKIVEQEGIDLFLLPSICPETFSFTTEEIVSMGYPLMVFDIGAPAERVRNYERGVVLGSIGADAVIEELRRRLEGA